MSAEKRYHAVTCDDSSCDPSCVHAPPVRYVPASGMFERLADDGQWYTLDIVEHPER